MRRIAVAALLAASFLCAGCREAPEKLEKSEMDSWHKPKRVDAVIEDKFFEDLIKPPAVQNELKRNIALYSGHK